jgi:hypothetical protein
LSMQVPAQDLPTFINAIAKRSVEDAAIAWSFITARTARYEGLFGGPPSDRSRAVDKMLARVASHFATTIQLDGLLTFFLSRKKAPIDPLPPFVQDAVSRIHRTMYVATSVMPKVCDWAEQNLVLGDMVHERE